VNDSQTRIVPVDGAALPADLVVPSGARGVVVFAHGSGSSRLSPRNRAVASALRARGAFGTLLFDLLTPAEDRSYENRFDIDTLTRRLVAAVKWCSDRPECAGLTLGLFGASTGAAAALGAAAKLGREIGAVVSRGGRPDLAGPLLCTVTAPTLLIVGGLDTQVIELNRIAFAALASPVKRLEIVPGATHLFEEPGTLDDVVRLSIGWFEAHLAT